MEVPYRVALDKQAKTLAHYLYDHGPIHAVYAGQAYDQVAKVLTDAIPRSRSFTRSDSATVVNYLYEKGLVHRVGKSIVTQVRWIGPDPSTLEWNEPKPKPVRVSRDDLEKRLRWLYDHLGIDWE